MWNRAWYGTVRSMTIENREFDLSDFDNDLTFFIEKISEKAVPVFTLEHFFLNFMTQCERSDLLLAALYEEYLKAKIRYKWLSVLNK